MRSSLLPSVCAAIDLSDDIGGDVEQGSRGSERRPDYFLQLLVPVGAVPVSEEILVSSARTLQCAFLSLLQVWVSFRSSLYK